MRKDSLVIFVTSIVLTLGIVGGAHYLYLQNLEKVPFEAEVKPPSDIATGKPYVPPVRPAVRRTATVIECTTPNGAIFYTNASRCEDADLNNRISIADPVKRIPSTSKQTSSSRKSGSNRQSLKSIPRSMTNACSFPIGKARRIEKKSLRLKDPPEESLWKDSYCRWVCEARVENCGDLREYLKYSSICPKQWHASKRSCGT